MSFHYEVTVELPLAEVFRQMFLKHIRGEQCCELFRLVTPDAPNIWDFRLGEDIFSIAFTEEAGEQKESIDIDSDTLDLTKVIAGVMEKGVIDFLIQFLSPLAKVPKAELEKRIKARLNDLERDLEP
jgi:hypothetical protein